MKVVRLLGCVLALLDPHAAQDEAQIDWSTTAPNTNH
jgi:hypothetical protein